MTDSTDGSRLDVQQTDWWQEEYEHSLAHYRGGAKTNFVCPGGDECSLRSTEGDATETA